MKKLPLSSYILIAANLIPLIGVLFYDWNAILVLALFWIENLIIGVFNVVRIVLAGIVQKDSSAILKSFFFILHYGLFCAVHGKILSDLIGYPKISYTDYFSTTSFDLFELALEGAAVFLSFVEHLGPAIWLGVTALVLSRFVSFIENFILRGEIFTTRVGKLMIQPYGQIMILHAGIIFGAILLEKFNSPIWLLAVIVIFKIMIDFKQHQRRHKPSNQHKEVIKNL